MNKELKEIIKDYKEKKNFLLGFGGGLEALEDVFTDEWFLAKISQIKKAQRDEIIEKIKKRDILSQSILLNWLRANTDLYDKNLENEFNRILKDFLIKSLK